MRIVIAAVMFVSSLALGAAAEEKNIALPPDNVYARLAPGPGSEQAQQQCQFCHSTDYIVMQPRGAAKQWQAVVTKMMTVFGAPVSEADAKAIVEYLTAAYGPRK